MSKFKASEHAGLIGPAVSIYASGMLFLALLWRQKRKCLVPKCAQRSSEPSLHFIDGETEATRPEKSWLNQTKEPEDRTQAGTQVFCLPDNCCHIPALHQL